jgi:IS5 family transposase
MPRADPGAASSSFTPGPLHGNSFDGHTLKPTIADLEKNTGIEVRRIHVDKGCHGHNHPHRFRVWISGQVRRTTAVIKRENETPRRHRADHRPPQGRARMSRNYLKGRDGDRTNAVLAAAGFNFHRNGSGGR